MQTERHVRLFRNGRNQAVRIPRDFEPRGATHRWKRSVYSRPGPRTEFDAGVC
jgi:hypothetical protein